MGWIIFLCYLIYGVVINLFIQLEKNAPEGSAERKRAEIIVQCLMWIGISSLGIFFLYCLGWIWYFFCGGFLLFEDQSFWDKVVCGLISLILFGFFIGFIMICCGWDPDQ